MNSAFLKKYPGSTRVGKYVGYAGGITSAAMDGIKVAEEIIRRYES